MEQTIVKTEIQPNGEILLYYVAENGENEEAILTTNVNMEEVSDSNVQQIYIEENIEEITGEENIPDDDSDDEPNQRWMQVEVNRLLHFYIDNKEIFISGATEKSFLWSIACKNMIFGRTPEACEKKFQSVKKHYAKAIFDQQRDTPVTWYLLEMAHQAFYDDPSAKRMIDDLNIQYTAEQELFAQAMSRGNDNSQVVTKKNNTSRSNVDDKVVTMLNLYIKHRNSLKNVQKDWQRRIWETVALEMGELDADYWHKRFLNFKTNYVRLLDKRKENGPESINWPYMKLFDKIFADDQIFQKKYLTSQPQGATVTNTGTSAVKRNQNNWNDTELTVLVKYCFDCLSEFQDPTIPNNFLWNEVGRLLEKNAELCKLKYEQLKSNHLDKYIEGGYDLTNRIPIDILFDNIISKDIDLELSNIVKSKNTELNELWKTPEIDELAQFFYENIEMFKDPICYYVCWAAITRKLRRTLKSCHRQWQDLTALYRSILDDKKENPDMQIDWRYIELFDRLFDYGMDDKLLEGYETLKARELKESAKKAKKSASADSAPEPEVNSEDEDYDERGYTRKRSLGESKAFKILEFYQKNKDKFSTTRKQALWEVLGKQIGINATKCAHRFRNLKQVYTGYVQREINKPEMPIVWPYYQLCKKVFGYRALKNKLKNSKMDSDDSEEWSSKEIKQLITYFSNNFTEISEATDTTVWANLASAMSKSENTCREKFMELRKSYRKLKTMKSRNPAVNVTWKYFNLFDEIYNSQENGYPEESLDVEGLEEYEVMQVDEDITQGLQEDDDIQCIFVIPEAGGEDLIIQNGVESEVQAMETNEDNKIQKPLTKWTMKTKKRLLILYINYIRTHKGQDIDSTAMWKEIAEKLPNKTPLSCRKIFAKLKKNRDSSADEDGKKKTPYYALLEKVIALKPKFKKSEKNVDTESKGEKVYKDVAMSNDKVQQGLEFYLQHIEEFISPRFEKKHVWSDLAKAVGEPVNKVFNKINYLKNSYETTPEATPFAEILKQISGKKDTTQIVEQTSKTENPEESVVWSDDEMEQLLIWYLANLDKFKNPKFVRKYLWIESSNILGKSPLACSKKMSEIRTQYRNMVRETPAELNGWRFYDLCQKIYGTGKQKSLG